MRAPPGRTVDLVAGAHGAARHLAGVAAVVVVLVAHRAHHPLDGEAERGLVAVGRGLELLEQLQQRRAVVVGRVLRALGDVVALERRQRDGVGVGELGGHGVEHGLVEVDEVHLVHAHHHVRGAQQGGDVGVAARLLDHALARVDQHQGDVGGGGARDHVARVLLVAGGVGEHELAPVGLEVAVGDVDGDALLALGAQAVGEQGEVHVAVAALLGGALDRLVLVLEDLLGLQQQPPDQGRLAVVHRAGGGDAQELRGALGRLERGH